jgi:CRISPR/Cas system Type II protein with McrA/HNH and RuvC-like nuclease domain
MNTSTEFSEQNENRDQQNEFTDRRIDGTMVDGKPFDDATIQIVWEKASKEFMLYYYRRDACGTVIAKHEYFTKTKYGWVIDHILPVSMGGTDDIDNLQALHWENNLAKGNDHPVWKGKQL